MERFDWTHQFSVSSHKCFMLESPDPNYTGSEGAGGARLLHALNSSATPDGQNISSTQLLNRELIVLCVIREQQ